MTAESMRDRFYRVTCELLDSVPRLAVVLADIGVGQFRALGALERHPLRVINVGIREQLMVSVAAGMAREGMRPIVHSYAPFLVERPFEQVKLDFAHQDVGGILVSVGASYDWAAGGRTHQSPGDVALMSSLPDWTVYVPGHPDEAEEGLRDAVAGTGRVYLRLAEQMNGHPLAGATRGIVIAKPGAAGGPTVLAVGPTLGRVIEAADSEATVLYTARPRPFDGEGLREQMAGTDVVLVEPYLEGTSAAEVSRALVDRPHRLLCIGVPHAEHRHYGSAGDHDRAFGLDANGLRSHMRFPMPA